MNQWVGIVALRDAPSAISTPLHRMATAIETANRIRTYSLGKEWEALHADIRIALRAIGRRYSSASDTARATASFRAVRFFPDHTDAWRDLPWWLQQDLGKELESSVSLRDNASSSPVHQPPRHKTTTPKPQPQVDSVTSAVPQRRTTPRTLFVERALEVMDVVRPPLTDPGTPFDDIDLAPTLIADLASVGLSIADDPVHARWIRIATLHASYVHEDPNGPASLLTPHTLTMLATLGGAWLNLLILDTLATDPTITNEAMQSNRLAQQRKGALRSLGTWASAAGFAHMGRGERKSGRASVTDTLALQILGALALIGAHEPLRKLVAEKTKNMEQSLAIGAVQQDWMTQLQERPYVRSMEWMYKAEGPDHETAFTATVRISDGRTASATGRSKKAARQAAAREFLLLHDPDFAACTTPRATKPVGAVYPCCYSINEPGHTQVVRNMRAAFSLPVAADPWLAQALTHKSWAYENSDLIAKANQRSNSLLAHLGSHVAQALMAYERAHEAAARGLRPALEEARICSVSNAECRRLGEELRLAPGMLIGTGERQNTLTDHGEDAAQAVLAVAWRYLGPHMLTRRPYALHAWFATMDHGHDPTTQVQNLCSRFGIRMEQPDFYVRGEDHALEWFCELVFVCDGKTVRWAGTPAVGSKTAAKKRACHEVLEILQAHASGTPQAWSREATNLLGAFLRQQLVKAPHLTTKEQLHCARGGDLGLDLLASGDVEGFREWAERTQRLTGGLAHDTVHRLTQFYAQCLAQIRYGDESSLRTALRRTAVGAASTSTKLAVAAVLRTAMAQEPADLRTILGAWWAKTAQKVHIRIGDSTGRRGGLTLNAVEAAAFREFLVWAAEAAKAVAQSMTVELTIDEERLYVLVGIDGVDVPKTFDSLLQLLDEVVPSMRCTVADDRLLLHWRQVEDAHQSRQAQLASAGLLALSQPLPVPIDLRRHVAGETKSPR